MNKSRSLFCMGDSYLSSSRTECGNENIVYKDPLNRNLGVSPTEGALFEEISLIGECEELEELT